MIVRATLLCLLAACAVAAPGPRLLFDFTEFDPARLVGEQATARVVDGLDGKALEITTAEGDDYPGVRLLPPGEAWDLTGCYALTAEVLNPGAAALRVLLQADNPGADGVNRCNAIGVTVDPGERVRIVMPFGEWHGQARPLELDQIVAVRVFVERPGGERTFLVDDIRGIVFDRAEMEPIVQSAYFQNLTNPLGRGINLGNMLEAPREGEWGARLDERYFDLIAEAGFTNVRIPCRWNAHAAMEPPYSIDAEFMARVDRAVTHALGAGLRVVLNIHHYDEMMRDPAGHRPRLAALWRQIAEHFAEAPAELWLELLNEPNGALTPGTWNEVVAELIPVVRESNPERMLVVGPGNWNSSDALPQLRLPEDDRNLTVTFHYYNPFQFTHQGAGWVGPNADQWLGTEWHGSDAEQRAVISQFDAALRWAVEHQRPLYLGEFGAYSRADLASRERWTRFIAAQAVERKMGFAYWEFCSGFGCYDAEAGAWREGLRDALLGVE